jgi:hypothetical protein
MNPYLHMFKTIYRMIYLTTPIDRVNEVKLASISLYTICIFSFSLYLKIVFCLPSFIPENKNILYITMFLFMLLIFIVNKYFYEKMSIHWSISKTISRSRKIWQVALAIFYIIVLMFSFFIRIW